MYATLREFVLFPSSSDGLPYYYYHHYHRHHHHYYLLTPWSTVLLEKLSGVPLDKFPAFYYYYYYYYYHHHHHDRHPSSLFTYLLHGAQSFLRSYPVFRYPRNSPHFITVLLLLSSLSWSSSIVITYLLASWSTVLFEKPSGFQLVKEFPGFYYYFYYCYY